MGELFLCSRAEVLRTIYIDTGRKMSLVGAPEEFLEWADRMLPTDTAILHGTSELQDHGLFDIILLWYETRSPPREEICTALEHLVEKGDLWVVVPRTIVDEVVAELNEKDRINASRFSLPLSMKYELVPVNLGSGLCQ
ncbi:MAG: hypothetical protein ACMUIE_05570 [Thermoplasmatota archaeon]